MSRMKFTDAVDRAIEQTMLADERVVLLGEDQHMLRGPLYARFGKERVISTPISEGAFVGAAVGAAMAGLRPIVDLMMIDFVAVAMDAVLNHMAKLAAFSGGSWRCPIVVRAGCGGGYGDGGQHGQSLWGLLAGIPGLSVVVPSNPADASGLMLSALRSPEPVFFLEHKLLGSWLELLGRCGRDTVSFDVPADGAEGEVPDELQPIPIGQARVVRSGDDVTLISLAVGLHRALAAATALEKNGVSCEVIDLRTVSPLDRDCIVDSVGRTRRLVVVDEDYRSFGLAAELGALVLEAGLTASYRRVCLDGTLPYARQLEDRALPSVERIVGAALETLSTGRRPAGQVQVAPR